MHLHDVNLTGGRPAIRTEVGTKHPECGPGTLTGRRLDARPDLAVLDREFIPGVDSRRSDRAIALCAHATVAASGNNQVAILNRDVVSRPRIVLPLVIAPAGVARPLARLSRPARHVEGRGQTRGSVEFVTPDKVEALDFHGITTARGTTT